MPPREIPREAGTTTTLTPCAWSFAAFSMLVPPSATWSSLFARRVRGVTMAVAPARPSSSAIVQPSEQPSMIGRKPNSWASRAISRRSVRSLALNLGRDLPVRMPTDF